MQHFFRSWRFAFVCDSHSQARKWMFPLHKVVSFSLANRAFSFHFLFLPFCSCTNVLNGPVCVKVTALLELMEEAHDARFRGWAPTGACLRCLPCPGEHKTNVLWAPQKGSFTKSKVVVFLEFWVLLSDLPLSDKNGACLVQFFDF